MVDAPDGLPPPGRGAPTSGSRPSVSNVRPPVMSTGSVLPSPLTLHVQPAVATTPAAPVRPRKRRRMCVSIVLDLLVRVARSPRVTDGRSGSQPGVNPEERVRPWVLAGTGDPSDWPVPATHGPPPGNERSSRCPGTGSPWARPRTRSPSDCAAGPGPRLGWRRIRRRRRLRRLRRSTVLTPSTTVAGTANRRDREGGSGGRKIDGSPYPRTVAWASGRRRGGYQWASTRSTNTSTGDPGPAP